MSLSAGTKGIIVADIEEGSPAAEAGLQVADIIQEVNRKPIRNMADFQSAMSTRGSQPILLLVNHEGKTLFVAVNQNE